MSTSTVGRSGLAALEDIDDVSVVAARGSGRDGSPDGSSETEARTIAELLIRCAARMRHRFAVVEPPDAASLADVVGYRGHFDSSRAAICHRWIEIADLVTGEAITVPPSGPLAGHPRPHRRRRRRCTGPGERGRAAGDRLRAPDRQSAAGCARPTGVNGLRSLDRRGHRVCGAGTMSSDPEWRYVDVRRSFSFIDESIDEGT